MARARDGERPSPLGGPPPRVGEAVGDGVGEGDGEGGGGSVVAGGDGDGFGDGFGDGGGSSVSFSSGSLVGAGDGAGTGEALRTSPVNSGVGNGSGSRSPEIATMKSFQIGAATVPPVAPGIETLPLGWPTHTQAATSLLAPQNHTSESSSVVTVSPKTS